MSVNIKVTGGLNIEWGQIDPEGNRRVNRKGEGGGRLSCPGGGVCHPQQPSVAPTSAGLICSSPEPR